MKLSCADAFELITTDALARFLSNEAAFVPSGDAEALHQMRTTLRELLSALWIFRPLLADEDISRTIVHELRQLNAGLGAIRNLDVCISQARPGSKEHSWLTNQRTRLRERACNASQSTTRQRIASGTLQWIVSRNWENGASADRDFRPIVTARMDRLWRKIRGFGDRPSKLGRRRRHRLRIKIKTLRYSLDFLQLPVCPAKPARQRFGTEVKALQKTLGKLNDLEIRRDLRAAAGLRNRRFGGAKRKHERRAAGGLRELRRIGRCWQSHQA